MIFTYFFSTERPVMIKFYFIRWSKIALHPFKMNRLIGLDDTRSKWSRSVIHPKFFFQNLVRSQMMGHNLMWSIILKNVSSSYEIMTPHLETIFWNKNLGNRTFPFFMMCILFLHIDGPDFIGKVLTHVGQQIFLLEGLLTKSLSTGTIDSNTQDHVH